MQNEIKKYHEAVTEFWSLFRWAYDSVAQGKNNNAFWQECIERSEKLMEKHKHTATQNFIKHLLQTMVSELDRIA